MRRKILYIIVLLSILMTGCSDDDRDKEVILTIASEKTTVIDPISLMEIQCLLVQENNNQVWFALTESIENFDYVEGFEYTIKVKKVYLKAPPQDASDCKYILIEVLSKTPKS